MARGKQPFKHRAVVDAIVAKLKELPDGTETSTSQVVEMLYGKMKFTENEYDYGAVAFSFEEYFEVDEQVRRQAKKAGLILDGSPWEDTVMGLPFHYPYLVNRKGGKLP